MRMLFWTKPNVPKLEYPITQTLLVADEPIEVVLSSTERYGGEDVSRDGDYSRNVVSGRRAASISVSGAEWSAVLPGVDVRTAAEGQGRAGVRGAMERKVTIRVRPEACPVLIQVDRMWAYHSEFRNECDGTRYAVRVVRRKKWWAAGRRV